MIRIPHYKPTGYNPVTFKSNKEQQNQQFEAKNEYQDPLLKWPIRGLAYSNELGAALSEIAPTLGTLLWFPAMLYFGADFYDKYKNEQTSYNPNAQRGTQQVIFQTLASVILPTASVIGGQKIASSLGVMGKTGLSLQSQEEVVSFLQKFSSRRHIEDFKDNKEGFKKQFEDALVIKREKLVRSNKLKKPFKLLYESIFKGHHPESIARSRKEKVLHYADKKIDQMFDIYNDLISDKKPDAFSEKIWKGFQKLKNKYSKDPEYKSTYIRDAAEDIILKFQKSQIRNAKLLKTLGGFVALGLAIKPIDNFVENVIIKKYVEPNLTYVFETTKKKDFHTFLKDATSKGIRDKKDEQQD